MTSLSIWPPTTAHLPNSGVTTQLIFHTQTSLARFFGQGGSRAPSALESASAKPLSIGIKQNLLNLQIQIVAGKIHEGIRSDRMS